MQFSEKDFYLAEFRSRTIGIALRAAADAQLPALDGVLSELALNRTRVLLMSSDPGLLERTCKGHVVEGEGPRWVGELWRAFGVEPCVGLRLEPEAALARRCGEVARELGLVKLMWLDARGGLMREGGARRSFVDLSELDDLIDQRTRLPREAGDGSPSQQGSATAMERLALLREIRRAVAGGVPAVNLCSLAGLADELFTYAGSGTLFTRDRYTDVRRLALDEFSTAHDLMARGVAEGYLVPRSDAELERVLANAFGVFVEGRFLAGIGALMPCAEERVGEIGSLYTLTRFIGEGVGDHLIRFALQLARDRGLDYVYACTTSERVQSFFVRHGFTRVGPEDVPAEKWQGYSEPRRAEVVCLRFDL